MAAPQKPFNEDAHSFQHCWIWDKLTGRKPLLIAGQNISIDRNEADATYTIHGSAKGGGRSDAWPPTIYDVASGYSVGDWVWVQAADTLTTTGAIYPPTGLTALSKAGLWRCLMAAPAGYFPVAPYPSPDDPTNANMYWLYLGNLYC